MRDVYKIFDLETNGLTLNDVEITQCSVLTVCAWSHEILEAKNKYYKVKNLKDSSKITGITEEFLEQHADGKFDDNELVKLLDDFEMSILVGYNVYYDIMVLDALSIIRQIPIKLKFPLDLTEQFMKNGFVVPLTYTLEHELDEEDMEEIHSNIKKHFGYEGLNSHNAVFDVMAMYQLIKNDETFKGRLKSMIRTLPND